MRLLQIVNTLAATDGGPAHNASALRAALVAQGHSLTRMVWSGSGDQDVDEAHLEGHPDIRGRLTFLAQLVKQVRNSDFVIIHGYYLLPSALGSLIALASGRQFAIVPHGVFTDYQRAVSPKRKKLFEALIGSRVLQKADFFAVGTEQEKVQLEAVSEVPVFVTGVHIETGNSSEKYFNEQGPLSILSLSRIAQKKRIDLSILALRWLLDRDEKVRLEIAGSGDAQLELRLKSMVTDLDLGAAVRWHGTVLGPEKISLLREAHVLVLPSEDENFGIGIADALSAGIPVVTTPVAAASSLIEETGAGELVERPTEASLGAAIQTVMRNYSEYAQAAQQASQVIEARYSSKAVAQRWIQAMQAS